MKTVKVLFLLLLIGIGVSGAHTDNSLSVLVIGDSSTEHGFITLALGDTLRNYYGGSTGTGYSLKVQWENGRVQSWRIPVLQ